MNSKNCPVCGSGDIIERKKSITLSEPFSEEEQVEIVEYYCNACESAGDFFNQNDAIIESNLRELTDASVINILNRFSATKISLSSIERALNIPQRTLLKWKNRASKPSSIGVALLRFMGLFPWLIEVAEHKFDYQKAQKIHLQVALNMLINQMKFDKNDLHDAGIHAISGGTVYWAKVNNSILDYENSDGALLAMDQQVEYSIG